MLLLFLLSFSCHKILIVLEEEDFVLYNCLCHVYNSLYKKIYDTELQGLIYFPSRSGPRALLDIGHWPGWRRSVLLDVHWEASDFHQLEHWRTQQLPIRERRRRTLSGAVESRRQGTKMERHALLVRDVLRVWSSVNLVGHVVLNILTPGCNIPRCKVPALGLGLPHIHFNITRHLRITATNNLLTLRRHLNVYFLFCVDFLFTK